MIFDWWSGGDMPAASDIATHEASLGDKWWTGTDAPQLSDIAEHQERLQGILPAGTTLTVPGDYVPQILSPTPALINVRPVTRVQDVAVDGSARFPLLSGSGMDNLMQLLTLAGLVYLATDLLD